MTRENVKTRPQPQQRRSAETVARILEVASSLLDEVGFDRLTTNLICSRAGLTPPALYRYFPNKYAIMEELGRRLMVAQNAALYALLSSEPALTLVPDTLATMLRGQYDVTCAQPGGRWIMRSLHSTPALVHIRLESHRLVTNHLVERYRAVASTAPRAGLERRYRIAVDAGYAVVELLCDEPLLDVDLVTADAALMIAALLALA